ncbi:MAG: hypothetical protein H0U74_18955 [Bradymonadaceae bacterium]|nr:hypothetical protein [Lujinxingiaceae bacterium]
MNWGPPGRASERTSSVVNVGNEVFSQQAHGGKWGLCVLVLVALWATLYGAPSTAQVVPETPLRIVVAPPFQVLLLHEDEDASTKTLGQSLQDGVTAYLVSYPEQFTLVTQKEFVGRLERNQLFGGTLSLARQWAEMGIEEYKRLQTREAIEHLEKALQNFTKIRFEAIEPEEIAEVLLYLTLAYLEDGGDVVRPLELIKMMIVLDPQRTIRAGYYPDYIVQFYRSAGEALRDELQRLGPSIGHAREIAATAGADAVLYGYVVPDAQLGARVLLYTYTVAADAFLPLEALGLGTLERDEVHEAGSRLMSRYSAYLFEERAEPPRPVEASQGQSALAIELQFAYATFLKFPSPIERSFGNYGVSVGANFSLTREFGVAGALQVLNSMRDYNGILREDFTTIRGFLGGQLGVEFYDFNLSIQTALELTHVGPIRAIGDKNCIPAPDLLCDNNYGTVVFDQLALLMGVNTRPRLSYRVTRALEAVASVSVSYYFYPMTDRILNFPLTAEVGVQYRF